MAQLLSPASRLIVAADFKPQPLQGRLWARQQVLALADSLRNTGVYIKVNSALRALGYDLIDEIHARGLKVFADLKFCDIPETLATDGAYLKEVCPELVTVMCSAGVDAMRALAVELPGAEVLGVTALTSLKNEDTQAMFSCSTEEAVLRFAYVAQQAKIDGLISSPREVEMLRAEFELLFSLNTPAIRPTWSIVKGDDQNPDRIMTPEKAIKAGADRIVVGRPIVRSPDPRAAVLRTIEEIERATGGVA